MSSIVEYVKVYGQEKNSGGMLTLVSVVQKTVPEENQRIVRIGRTYLCQLLTLYNQLISASLTARPS